MDSNSTQSIHSRHSFESDCRNTDLVAVVVNSYRYNTAECSCGLGHSHCNCLTGVSLVPDLEWSKILSTKVW